jgi:hypothetical protein
MKRIVLLLLILVACIGENEAQSRKKYTSKQKKKTKKEIIVESEPEIKKIRKINLHLNFMRYNINSISTEYWPTNYYITERNQGIYEDYQLKERKTGSFSNIASFGGGIKTFVNVSPKLKFEYGLGVDLMSLIYNSDVETIDRHLFRKFKVIKESSYIYTQGKIEILEEYPRLGISGYEYYQSSEREEHNFIMLVLPLELRYNIYKNFDITGGLVTRLPVFERRAFEVRFYDNPIQTTSTRFDNGPLINRFLAFASIGARFQTNQGFTIGLSYQHLLNSFIMRRSELLRAYDFNNKRVSGSQINFSVGYSF